MSFTATDIQDRIDLLSSVPGSLVNDFNGNGIIDASDAMNDLLAEALNLGTPATQGVSINNVVYTGAIGAAFEVESFDIGSGFPVLDGGILLSSGDLPDDTNDEPGDSFVHSTTGDVILDGVAQAAFGGAGATNDAATVSFNLTNNDPTIDGIRFDIVFGSEEFPEFSNSSFVDVAAVFVNGVNFGLFNEDPTTPLSVIDDNLNTGNFVDNQGGQFNIEWDGFSNVLSIRAPLETGVNSIFFGVADTGDFILDSGLYLTNFSFLEGATGGSLLTVVPDSDGSDALEASENSEEFVLTGGDDTVSGGLGELDGDIITGFGPGDVIEILNEFFSPEDLEVTFGSAILDIGGITLTLEGEFEDGDFNVETTDAGTEITFDEDDEGGDGGDGGDGGSDDDPIEIRGGSDDNELTGAGGNDTLVGQGGEDTLNGEGGDDLLLGGGSDDVIFGGADDDRINGGAGDDEIFGEAGDDRIVGRDGNDLLDGGLGNDRLLAGSGADTVNLGEGNDLIRLGDGRRADGDVDTLVLDTANSGNDRVDGFDVTLDQIDLGLADFTISSVMNGRHTRIDIDDGGSILLRDVDADDVIAAVDDIFI